MERIDAIREMTLRKKIYHIADPTTFYYLKDNGRFYREQDHYEKEVDFCNLEPGGWSTVGEPKDKPRSTMVYKIEVYVLDLEYVFEGKEDVQSAIENVLDYSHVTSVQSANVGVWYDDHPLNKPNCDYSQYFK